MQRMGDRKCETIKTLGALDGFALTLYLGSSWILNHGSNREYWQVVEKCCLQAGQKDLRGEAREKSTSGGVLRRYVGARRLSATKHMSLFQQPVRATFLPSRIIKEDRL